MGPTGCLGPAAARPLCYLPPDAHAALVMLDYAGWHSHARKGARAALVPSGAQPYLVSSWGLLPMWTQVAGTVALSRARSWC